MKRPRLYGEMTALLHEPLASADGKRKIAAGTIVLLQFDPDSLVSVVPAGSRDERSHIGCSLKEVCGSELLEQR